MGYVSITGSSMSAEGAFPGGLLDPSEQLEKLERDERRADAKRERALRALH